MKKRKLRKKIADRVENKMMYMNTCLNERDIILNIILSKKDKFPRKFHCDTDCGNTNCEGYKIIRKQDGGSNGT